MATKSEVHTSGPGAGGDFPHFNAAELAAYQEKGFVIVPGLFAEDEIGFLKREAERNLAGASLLKKADRAGNPVDLAMWNRAEDDIYGMFSRNERVVSNVEALLGGEAYLYSAKMIMKNAREGGAWEWHQDYGYWYDYGCLVPSMLSCLIAVDRATQENGCLQVLSGSHILGRVNHDRINEQTMANPEHVEAARARFTLVYLELNPGDAVFFHCNLLHRSDANRSEHRRWNYIASYNTVENKPYKRVRDYGNYEPLLRVPTTAIRSFAAKHNL
ncbi:MAG TPA: phytanoyl-CoA dioxygenase family protein [Candidatus Eisenbacteria bacterium]|nr:phytanoyl-CoA dioxygenase family protein [Candidatus Eisenbacteria bacterium]